MIGIWKNFDDLEESISLPELAILLENKREIENAERKFLAGLQGIELEDEEEMSVKKRLEAAHHRAAVRLAGGEAELERKELTELGFAFG